MHYDTTFETFEPDQLWDKLIVLNVRI